MDDWYQQFLRYRHNDYEDFEQYYNEPEDDDYDEHAKTQASNASAQVFGVSWDQVTPQIVARKILDLQQRAQSYRSQPKQWRRGTEGTQERNAIENILYHINVAIFFKVPRTDHKQFSHQSDRVNQIVAEE